MIRILFVDDEVYLLEALKRILQKKNNEWETSYAGSGKEAVELINKHQFDIIVTDYKMPEMDGLELLAYVKERFSRMKRIILSGQSFGEINEKPKGIADIYLEKPYDPEALIKILEEEGKK
jgi:YesN/AraC family two-component response regulator